MPKKPKESAVIDEHLPKLKIRKTIKSNESARYASSRKLIVKKPLMASASNGRNKTVVIKLPKIKNKKALSKQFVSSDLPQSAHIFSGIKKLTSRNAEDDEDDSQINSV